AILIVLVAVVLAVVLAVLLVTAVFIFSAAALRAVRDAAAGTDDLVVDGDVVHHYEPHAVGILCPGRVGAFVKDDGDAPDRRRAEDERGRRRGRRRHRRGSDSARISGARRRGELDMRPLPRILRRRRMQAVGAAEEVAVTRGRHDVEPRRAGATVGAVAVVEGQLGDGPGRIGDDGARRGAVGGRAVL